MLGLILMAAAVLATGAATTQPAPGPGEAAALARVVDRVVTEQMQRPSGAPVGAVVVVVKDGAVALAKGYGFADVAAQRPMSADGTLVHVGSISKLFTGIAIMQLVERGVLDLGRDVNDYLDFRVPTPPGGVPVTLRRLLTHRAGFEEHAKDLFSRERSPAPLGAWLARSLPRRLFPGGDVSAYSNYGMALAGYVVERASGTPFAAYMRDRILDPLGMAHSTFEQPLPPALAPMMAKSYFARNALPLPFVEVIEAAPAGALAATGADMGRFLRALLARGTVDGQRVLAPATLAQMMAPAVVTATGSMGLAFFETRIDEQRLLGHSGGTLTFSSRLLLSQEQRLGLFLSYDGGEVDVNELPRAIFRHYVPPADGAPGSEAAERAEAAAVSAPGAPEDVPIAARAAGAYQSTRRADSTFVRFDALLSQIVFRDDGDGTLTRAGALPFGKPFRMRRDQRGAATFHDEKSHALAFTFAPDGAVRLDMGAPALAWQRVPAYLDARVVLPVVGASALFALLAVLAWPARPLVRRLRRRFGRASQAAAAGGGESPAARRAWLVTRLVLAVQVAALAMAVALLVAGRRDLTLITDAIDPIVVGLYGLAWLGVVGSVPCVAVAAWFWTAHAGTRAGRIRHTVLALAAVVLAWFFVTWRIAGTTLVY